MTCPSLHISSHLKKNRKYELFLKLKMKELFRIIVWWFLFQGLSALKHSRNVAEPTNRKMAEPANNIIFERIEFVKLNKSLFHENLVFVRSVAPNVLKVNISVTINQPINKIWIRTIFNRKQNTYNKFLIDVAFELCGLLDGTLGNPMGEIMVNNFALFDRNFELKCPFKGTLIAGSEHFNASYINFPLLPAGRYRVDIVLSLVKTGPIFGTIQIYFQVSDLRVWF